MLNHLILFSFLALATSSTNAFAKAVVNDVTNINPITVENILVPTKTDEIKKAIQSHSGPISIGGGRYSMGGQTATENALQIDMRSFNKIIHLDVINKRITVQAGIRWRDIQEEIDKHGLAVKIMQSYSNFTVGGSVSVNCHGRYIGEGPLERSIESMKIILADGNEVIASKTVNPEIFYSAVGGYGAMGVITEVTLNLATNEKIRREVKDIPLAGYKNYFLSSVRDNNDILLHNGDIIPPAYEKVTSVSWHRTDKPLTVPEKLVPRGQKYWLEPNAISAVSTLPFGMELRSRILDPIFRKKETVVWRNYEASLDLAKLEPSTPRLLYTYVLQEYFVPVNRFDEFALKMRKVFQKHKPNILNVSVRHAHPDSGTYLAWAPEEVFSFVIYYKQGTGTAAKKKVGIWTRELIDEVLSVNGRYYLPYQLHATEGQFQKAYPGHKKFFAAKKKYDPTNKFRNKLWDKYYE